MKITVITVTYNCAATLQATIDSVVNQTYSNIEYIIVDGASTDGTLDIIKANENKITRWISEPDKGIYDAMNKGIDMATGDYIYFLGGDDTLKEGIVLQVASKLKDPNTIYYGDVIMGDTGKRYRGKTSAAKLAIWNICHQAIFYPIAAFSKRKYSLKYKLFADHYFNMQGWSDPKIKFQYIPIIVALYTNDGRSQDANKDKEFFLDFRKNVIENLGLKAYIAYKIVKLLVKIKKAIYR